MLAKTALLRAPVPEDRRDRVELLRLGFAVEAVLQVGADDRRGRLGAKRQRAAAAVDERVHLLAHHVRALARRPREVLGVLEHRRLDAAVAVQVAESLELLDHPLPQRLVLRQHVVRAPRRLETRAHARPSPATAPGRQSRPPPRPDAPPGTWLSGPVRLYCALRPST